VMGELGMIEHLPPASRLRHRVEDARQDSGHLQIHYTAKTSGYFEPAVALGDLVDRGHRLGTIVDPLGEVQETVTSTQSGMVLVLRVLPSVRPGDCLAVILELDPL